MDLDSTLRGFSETFDLANSLNETTSQLLDSITAPGQLAGIGALDAERRSQLTTINTSRQARKYVAPMRGRGWLGPPGSGHRAPPPSLSSLGIDPRNRAPNTSRPPSMHVDDFQKFEKVHPTGIFKGGYRGRGHRGIDRNSTGRSSVYQTPGWSRASNASKPSVEDLLALANDPVVMAASAISNFTRPNPSNLDPMASLASLPFLSGSQSTTTSSQIDALIQAASSGGANSGGELPHFPLPLPMPPLPEGFAKLAASMLEGSNNNNNESDSRRRRDSGSDHEGSSGRRRRNSSSRRN